MTKVRRLTYQIKEEDFGSFNRASVNFRYKQDLGHSNSYYVKLQVKRNHKWTRPEWFMYDTGSPITFLPKYYKKEINPYRSAICYFGGINESSASPFEVFRTKLKFRDIKNKSSPIIEAWVAIPLVDDIMPIVGMKDIYNTHRFITSPHKDKFYLDFYNLL